ncbi:MAG TPA: DUF4242 domain-containing protein [Gemmatimonadaceae bacterium]
MPKYLIERELPGAGRLSREDLRGISEKWCGTIRETGARVQWVQSYVTGDRITSIYIAPDVESVRQQAELEGIPANEVLEISEIIDPTTAEHRLP